MGLGRTFIRMALQKGNVGMVNIGMAAILSSLQERLS
jgi:hypothetical protein